VPSSVTTLPEIIPAGSRSTTRSVMSDTRSMGTADTSTPSSFCARATSVYGPARSSGVVNVPLAATTTGYRSRPLMRYASAPVAPSLWTMVPEIRRSSDAGNTMSILFAAPVRDTFTATASSALVVPG
jgi:hypothetical protein